MRGAKADAGPLHRAALTDRLAALKREADDRLTTAKVALAEPTEWPFAELLIARAAEAAAAERPDLQSLFRVEQWQPNATERDHRHGHRHRQL